MANNISEIKGVNDRLATLTIQINRKYTLQVIQVYAQTSTHEDDEVEELYHEIDKLLQTKTQYIILLGNLNGKVEKRVDEEDAVGEFGSGERNERGERLVEFAAPQNLKGHSRL